MPTNGYPCPACDKLTQVKDSRRTVEGFMRRRRVCECGFRFITVETPIGLEEPKVEQAREALDVALTEARFHLDKLTKVLHAKVEIARDRQLNRKRRKR